MTYVDLLRTLTNLNRMGGIVPELLFAPISTFTAIQPLPSDAPVGDGATCVIAGDHTFGVGDGFLKLQLSIDALNKFMQDFVGEGDNGGSEPKIEAFVAGLSKELAEFFANAPYEDFICLIKLPDGKYIQLGTEDFPAMVKGSYTSGTTSEGANGWNVTAKAFEKRMIFYEGTVTLKP